MADPSDRLVPAIVYHARQIGEDRWDDETVAGYHRVFAATREAGGEDATDALGEWTVTQITQGGRPSVEVLRQRAAAVLAGRGIEIPDALEP